MRIFIVGMPGSGKSVLGEQLAKLRGLPFYDLDEGVVKEEGMSIPEIFEKKGEKYFRTLESKLLRRLPDMTAHFVLSTGGGAPCFFDNMGFMNDEGKTVFLDVPLDILARRLILEGVSSRPLLKDHDEESLKTYLSEQLENRSNYYSKSMLTVTGKDITVEELDSSIRSMGW